MSSALATTPDRALTIVERRDLFWQNVIREILSSLAAAAAAAGGRINARASGAVTGVNPTHEMFDGRLAVITRLGQRIAIADVFPVFACSLPAGPSASAADRMLATDVQCTVFQIRTPGGEIFTLPLHEISGFHSLTPELIRQLEQSAASQSPQNGRGDPPDASVPFGFRAFTSLARSESATPAGPNASSSGTPTGPAAAPRPRAT